MLRLVVAQALLRAGRLHAAHRTEQINAASKDRHCENSKDGNHACTSSSVGGRRHTNGFPNALWEREILLRDFGPDDPPAGNRLAAHPNGG